MQVIDICQILHSARGGFVANEALQINKVSYHAIQVNFDLVGIAFGKSYPNKRCLQVNPVRWISQLDDRVCSRKSEA